MSVRVSETFAALGDPVRSAIVDRLVGGDATVGELAGMFTITLQAVSQQIGTLERSGLVTRHREGRTRRVHLQVEHLQEASRWMEAQRLRLEERYQRLDDVLTDVLTAETAARSDPLTQRLAPTEPKSAPSAS